jgi:hypothetical protein
MRRTTARSRLAGALALVALLAGCAEGESPPPTGTSASSPPAAVPTPSSPSPAPPTAPVTAEEAEQQVLDAYMGMQAAFAEASKTSDPDYPDLRKYTTGSALKLFQTALAQRKKDGIIARGGTINHPKVTELSPVDAPTKALVTDCMDTRNGSLYKPSGEPVPQDKGGFRLALADLERSDGTWKVTALAVREVGTCKL